MTSLIDFLLARLAEDEAAATVCAEMFPSPWEVADRGWRVRIYSAPVPDTGDHAEPGWERVPVVMEVEPDRHIEDPRWLSERVDMVARHDPARVLADVATKRKIVERGRRASQAFDQSINPTTSGVAMTMDLVLADLASVYADHPDYRAEWRL